MRSFIFIVVTLLIFSCQSQKSSWHMGKDGNENGVRDDVEKWINDTFTKDERERQGMLQLAAVDPASCDYKFYFSCLSQVSENSFILQVQLMEKLLNTDERRKAFETRVKPCAEQDDRTKSFKCNF